MNPVHAYHDGTKHHFGRFARSLGYLDWASQPDPFRSFRGAAEIPLHPPPDAPPLSTIAHVLRHALGLSAWKRFGGDRWALRVNPSSGNLHPTEAYVVALERETPSGPVAAVFHYASDRDALERRCAFDADGWSRAVSDDVVCLVALTSVHWREAWKYGERAFRYCELDIGHAIAAIRFAAALAGCAAALAPEWSHDDIAALTGIDRDEDYVEAEREEPGCLLVVGRQSTVHSRQSTVQSRQDLLDAVRAGQWSGRANQLSEDHVQWTFIDEIARATKDPGRSARSTHPARPAPPAYPAPAILQRRSALGFDGRSSIDADRFFAMLARVVPSEDMPWDALWWDARVHLALFVHRVVGLEPGLYLLVRNPRTLDLLKTAMTRDFAWSRAHEALPLFLLAPGDCRRLAGRLSCDQDIAADGFFSLAMIAEFDASLDEFGPSFYRHLYWECGIVGQTLYLEAEAAGGRATGIGCFYDDPVHDVLGLTGHAFQVLYHFSAGVPVGDRRLTTEPGYAWEK